jgi:hypothetical protein
MWAFEVAADQNGGGMRRVSIRSRMDSCRYLGVLVCSLSSAMASSALNGCTPHEAVLKGTFGGTRGKSIQE